MTSSPPIFYFKVTVFILSSLHTTSTQYFTFTATVHLLVYCSAFSIGFCNSSGVSEERGGGIKDQNSRINERELTARVMLAGDGVGGGE